MRKWLDPMYGTLDVSGPDNKKIYTMYVKCRKTPQDEGEIVGIGCLSQKKGGEQMAAKAALVHFGVYKEGNQEEEEEVEVLTSSDESDNNKVINKSDEYDDDNSDYESDVEPEDNTLKCKKCKKQFIKEHLYKKHITTICK